MLHIKEGLLEKLSSFGLENPQFYLRTSFNAHHPLGVILFYHKFNFECNSTHTKPAISGCTAI